MTNIQIFGIVIIFFVFAIALILFSTKCNHPFDYLAVEKDSTQEQVDEDFYDMTYYFHCRKCNQKLYMTYAKFVDGADGFLKRGK